MKNVPLEIEKFLSEDEKNWNYRTLKEEAELFDKIEKNHRSIAADRFWKSLIRGGLQAALYVCDCSGKTEVSEK